MIVLVDTREKKNKHILDKLKELNINYVLKKLDFGDYSFSVNDKSYENKIMIERKASLTELAGNFAKGKIRFDKEFKRASAKKCKVVLMIENASYEKIRNHEYRSSLSPKEYLSRLKTWKYSHQLRVEMVDSDKACELMLDIFNDYLSKENGS